MKKILIVLSVLALSSCAKELTRSLKDVHSETLKARIVNTKVNVDNLGKLSWTAGDKIAVHRSVNGYETATLSADGSFSIHLSDGEVRDGYAVYPADVLSDAASLTINLPAAYSIAKTGMGDYSPLPMVAVNDPASDELYFRHLGGILRLVFPSIPYETQEIIITLDKKITGSFPVEGLATESPYISSTAEPGEDIVFTLSSPAKEKEEFVINLPVPVGTYETLTYKIYDRFGNLVNEKTQDISVTVERADGFEPEIDATIDVSRIPLCAMLDRKGSVRVVNGKHLTMEYSLDNETWTSFSGDISIPLDRGQRVYFRGSNSSYYSNYNSQTYIESDVKGFLFGNVMSLITPEPDDFSVLKVLTGSYTFAEMFGSNNWYSHPDLDLLLPATTLTNGCYQRMFYFSCISRIDLPATELAEDCYSGMFENCANQRLTHCPVRVLPATNLPDNCYASMFNNCWFEEPPVLLATRVGNNSCSRMFAANGILKEAPELYATILGMSSYLSMFEGCTALTRVPYIANVIYSTNSCFQWMFRWCESLSYMKVMFSNYIPQGVMGSEEENWLTSAPAANGTFVMNSNATYNPEDIGIPTGWTIETASE